MNYIVDIIKSLFPDSQTALFFIVLSLITLWMYKQIRTSVVESEKNNMAKTDKAIEAYSELDAEIRKALKNKSELTLIDVKVTKASPYMPFDILDKLQEWVDNSGQEVDYEELKTIQNKLRGEIRRLKQTQFDPVTYKSSGGLTEFIHVYFKTKLSSFVEPLFHTGVGIFILMILILFLSVFATTKELTEQVLLISLLIALIVSILVLDIIISEVLLKSRFVHSKLNWIALVSFLLVILFLLFLGPWFRGILMIVSTFAYAFYATTYSIKNIGKNKKTAQNDELV